MSFGQQSSSFGFIFGLFLGHITDGYMISQMDVFQKFWAELL
jgi:hypothetical protein